MYWRRSLGVSGGTDGVGSGAAPSAPKTLNVLLVGEPRGLTAWKETTTGGVFNVHETITDGLENTPRAFIGMLNGENRGKALVKVTAG